VSGTQGGKLISFAKLHDCLLRPCGCFLWKEIFEWDSTTFEDLVIPKRFGKGDWEMRVAFSFVILGDVFLTEFGILRDMVCSILLTDRFVNRQHYVTRCNDFKK